MGDKAKNVAYLLDANLEAGRGDHPAVITNEGKRTCYRELFVSACRVAARLKELGVRREERVLLVLDDTPAFPAAFLGAMRIGAVPIPTNFLARPEDFAYFLDDAYASVAIIDAGFVDALRPFLAERPHVRTVIAHGDAPPDESLDAWMANGVREFPILPVHPEDMAFWLYSSGSTGVPKGVVHRHADVWVTCETYARQILGTTSADTHFSTTKLFHAYGLGNGLTFPFWSGATAVYLKGRPAPDRVLGAIQTHRPTLLFSVPTLYNLMMASPGFQDADFSSVRLGISAAEPLPPDVMRRFQSATGVEILDGIGSTEMLHIYCSNRPGAARPGSSGLPVAGYEVEIRDEHGDPVKAGESGELFVKGDSALSFYWHQRAKTLASLRGAWFASGDRYHQDQDGYLYYEGRVDDMMKVGGLWVSPIEIENRLMEHDRVMEAAVIGVHVDGLMRIKAYVIPAGPVDDALPDALREWCRAALQRYQYPHLIEFTDDLPRTSTGKIQRFRLRSGGPEL